MADHHAAAPDSRQNTPRGGNSTRGSSRGASRGDGTFSAPEHTAPPLTKITRTQEEIDKYAERLYRRPKSPEAKDGHMLAQKVVKPKEEIDQQVERLYSAAMKQRAAAREKAVANHEANEKRKNDSLKKPAAEGDENAHPGKLSEEEMAENVTRLYNQALTRHKQAHEESTKKYLFSPPVSPRGAVKPAEAAARLYDEAMKKRKEAHDELWDQYVHKSMPHSKKLTPEEAKASGNRLSVTAPKS